MFHFSGTLLKLKLQLNEKVIKIRYEAVIFHACMETARRKFCNYDKKRVIKCRHFLLPVMHGEKSFRSFLQSIIFQETSLHNKKEKKF